jgi:ADP-heptose:LPS heptosyltransferase
VSVPTRIGWTHTWANIAAVRRASAQVAALKPSIAVDPRWSGDLVQEALMVKWSGAARRIGFSEKANSSRSRQSVGFDRLFTDTHLGRPGVHESRQMLLLLDLLNMPAAGEQTELWLTEDDATVADSALASSGEGRGWVAISPGAGRPNRCWSPSRFAVVASALAADGWQPVVIGGPEDRAAGEVVAAGSAQARNLVGRLTLRQTAAVLTRCRLLVANDSAPAHLATAVRTPVVELSTHPIGAPPDHDNAPERWAPLGTVLRPMALAGCEMGCVADSPHCINGTDAQDVIAAARQLLAANPDPLSHNGPGTATS